MRIGHWSLAVGFAGAAAAALGATACLEITGACAGVGYTPLRLAITNLEGEGQALGAKVTLTDGAYVEVDQSDYDPTFVGAADDRGGRTYEIRVSKPFYNDVVIHAVRAPGGGCVTTNSGFSPITIPVMITVSTGAPALRSVHLVPPRVLLDRGYTTSFAFRAYVDADNGVSRGIAWSIAGDTASVGFDPVSGTLTYRCRPTSGHVAIVARALADTAVVGSADVDVQGHPGNSSDPPCG